MKFVYAQLSEKDYIIARGGGAGLGNILFTYARSVIYARKHGCKVIWPTWPSIKIGPIIRREKDKRFYFDLFRNKSSYIGGLKKAWLLMTKQRISEAEALSGLDCENKIITFKGFEGCFEPIMGDSAEVYQDIVANLHRKNRKALEFKGEGCICMHVRLGDFHRASWEDVKSGKHDSSIPIEWYVQMANELRSITGEKTKIYVFSDGTDEELTPLLGFENTERITFGTSIADILALSKAGVFVASGSSFSMWARYLGRMTTIMFPNQEKQKILFDEEDNKEISAIENIPEAFHELIRKRLG